jgi:replicative superfamily II helicase
MVDFKKLREENKQSVVIHPIEIFRRLPKPPGINDIYTSQAEVLENWFQRRNEKDIVIKLHTGGGKTLVGLLIAQSVMNETHEPVLYLCPTKQLVTQTATKSNQYGIPCITYETGIPGFRQEFLASKSVLIASYEALFSGRSKFGVLGQGKEIIRPAAIILDDAHVAYSRIREAFTLNVNKDDDSVKFDHLTNLFRKDFEDLGKLGLFNDTITGREKYSILEIPYWAWQTHMTEVHEFLRIDADEDFPFPWPLIRDSFEYCHVLISKDSFVITPYFPLTDLIPAFAQCPKRIYMSATIADDSTIIRTFDANKEFVSRPITSNSLAGVGERMILVPEWMKIKSDPLKAIKTIAKWAAEDQKISTVILTPSGHIADMWNDVAQVVSGSEDVSHSIHKLQTGQSKGPFAFANRYDGIDLPGDACRILIFANMPRGTNEYENYLANLFEGSILNNTLAQKIEQGIGRGARGSGDYCIILLYGKDVLSWVVRTQNARFLTRITRAQLKIGMDISQTITNSKEFGETILSCLSRNEDWVKYHAETLAELTEPDAVSIDQLEHAETERKALQLWRDGNYEKAIAKLIRHCETAKDLDNETKGWFLQLAARIAFFGNRRDLAQDLQRQAFALSRNLFRPQSKPIYTKLAPPSFQSVAIVNRVGQFRIRKGYLAKFEEIVSHLVPEASSNQFEQALADLGSCLGFNTERPEKSYGVGPDVLWLINDKKALVIEAKSRKEFANPLTKADHGQLLVAELWFKGEYTGYEAIRVSVHPNRKTTEKAVAGDTRVLTYEKLNSLITNARRLISDLCESVEPEDQLIHTSDKLLAQLKLTPEEFETTYLEFFE